MVDEKFDIFLRIHISKKQPINTAKSLLIYHPLELYEKLLSKNRNDNRKGKKCESIARYILAIAGLAARQTLETNSNLITPR